MNQQQRTRAQRVMAAHRRNQQRGAVRWTPAPNGFTPAMLTQPPTASNPFRVGDVLTTGQRGGLWGNVIVTASYAEYIDFAFFAAGEMDATDPVYRVWVGNVGVRHD